MEQDDRLKDEVQFSVPLAVYREIAAHLRQVEGVQTGLYPANSDRFDYNQSQVRGLWIEYAETTSPQSRKRVEQILAYYQERYGFCA